jgi:chromate transporter
MSADVPAIGERTREAHLDSAKPTEREAFWFWLKLGCISFGGPAGQIAIMHDELVERRCWIGERRFLHALNFFMALPGPEAQQLASYIGYSMYGVRGAITSGGLFVLPSFVLLCGMSAVNVEYGEVAAVAGIVRGLGAAVIALVAAAVIRVGGRVIHTPAAIAMAAAAFGLIVAGVPFPIIIAIAALAGYLGGKGKPSFFGKQAGHGADDEEPGASEPLDPGLRRRFVKTLALWLIPVACLLLIGGFVAQLAGFFTLAALITFGGAYAVLPFVASAAVTHYGWLTSQDMVAGLALGESTPGPLIMVNTFAGFVAGYNVEGGLGWGLAGATIATLCTFVPSFVFIISGAPDHRPHPPHRLVRQRPQRHHHRRRRRDRRARRVRRPPRRLPRRRPRLARHPTRRSRVHRRVALPNRRRHHRCGLRARRTCRQPPSLNGDRDQRTAPKGPGDSERQLCCPQHPRNILQLRPTAEIGKGMTGERDAGCP